MKIHATTEADRVIDEIKPLAVLLSGGESQVPQERIDARLLQNAASSKAHKTDRIFIRAQKARAKTNARQAEEASVKRRKVCPRGDCATDSSASHGGTFIRANVHQAAHVDVAVSEDEAIENDSLKGDAR